VCVCVCVCVWMDGSLPDQYDVLYKNVLLLLYIAR